MKHIRILALTIGLGLLGCNNERVQAPNAGNGRQPVAPGVTPPAGKASSGNPETKASVPGYDEKGTLYREKNQK